MTSKVFRDAVHNMISLHREAEGPAPDPVDWGDALLLDLIDTPEMQRLRRIRQLGPAARVYPSAEHSRFSHALGTLHLAKRILTALVRPPAPRFDRQTLLLVKVAALFHDVGHGPYSHVFEMFHPQSTRHETWGWNILSRQGGAPRRIIQAHCQRLELAEAAFFQGLQQTLGISPAPDGEKPLGHQVISSQLDADRMDYLLRDAHFSGVSYGRYDLEWLLHSLRARKVKGVFRLCVDISRGPAALETYIAARDHMYRQVYDHKTVRAFEVLMVHLFQLLERFFRDGQPLPAETPPELSRFLQATHRGPGPTLVDYLALDDTVLDYAIGSWANMKTTTTPWEAELRWKSRLLHERKPVYRRLAWRFNQGEGGKGEVIIHDPQAADALERFFRERGEMLLTIEDPDGNTRDLPLALLARVDRLERAPYGALQYLSGEQDPIFVVDGTGEVQAAEQVSPRINLLGHRPRRLARVFVDPRAEKAVAELVKRDFSNPGVVFADTRCSS